MGAHKRQRRRLVTAAVVILLAVEVMTGGIFLAVLIDIIRTL